MMHGKAPVRSALLFGLSFAATCCYSQANRALPAHKLAKPPTIDGSVNAEEWAEAARADTFVDPHTGQPARLQTYVLAGYDAEALYFAFVAQDSEPSLIRATEYRRQGNLEGDDHVIVAINPLNSSRSADFSEFSVNTRGAARVEFAGGRAAKREWQGEWTAQARVTETGYEVEIRIPWKILRFPAAGKRNITLDFARYIPRLQELDEWSDLGPDERFERAGTWTDIEVPPQPSDNVIEALPYQIAGYGDKEQLVFNTGVDMRHQFGTNVTALGTINPDFKNVENAVLGIEFSRFERLAQEVGSSRVDLQACKLEYSIVSPK